MASQHIQSKPIKLTNLVTGVQFFDTLHASACQAVRVRSESKEICLASLMNPGTPLSNNVPADQINQLRSTLHVLEEAQDFYQQYFASVRRLNTPLHQTRWETVKDEIAKTGTYTMTEIELNFGAKLAWRNAPRCIGRIQWAKLQLFDVRHVTTGHEMFEAICNHIKYATNKGNLRSAISIFPAKSAKGEFRIWNPQFFGYAGYKQLDGSIKGDPINVQFTQMCTRLGWTGTGSRFDLLPLVLQVAGQDPEWFHIPPELILQVQLTHPSYEWFSSLNLQWYALPAVCSMKLDCGGLEFTAAPFNGWYMVTEIGSRDLADPYRYNTLPSIAIKMGLDTTSQNSLWRDKAAVELNLAVLYSFQKANVTIVDHYSAAESFLKHVENEARLRGGCPADWIWIVPPTSGSLTPVFHQEMANYCLKPSYEYQEPAWRHHVWENSANSSTQNKHKLKFKEVAKAVKFTSNLFGKALSKRVKATILFATETGKSEKFARTLSQVFQHAFNANVACMEEYDMINLDHAALLLVVTSTFGNGDPPENGQTFAQELFALTKHSGNSTAFPNKTNSKSSRSFIKMNSQSDSPGYNSSSGGNRSERLQSTSSITSDMGSDLGPLSNLRYAVFALGSSAYPNYCAFGKYVDHLLGELGGEKLVRLTTGDEMNGQEQAFKNWAQQVFHTACESFCLEDIISMEAAQAALRPHTLARDHIRFVAMPSADPLALGLARVHNKKVKSCQVIFNENITTEVYEHSTRRIRLHLGQKLATGIESKPGDHVGVFAVNNHDTVTQIMEKLFRCPDLSSPLQLQTLNTSKTFAGDIKKNWADENRLPVCCLYDLLAYYLDVTTPPSQALLSTLATYAINLNDQQRLLQLSTNATEYEMWKQTSWPDLLQTMDLFPSIQVDAAILVSQLPILQPRFYSLSSFPSPTTPEYEFDLTLAVVTYETPCGTTRNGICSHYLAGTKPGSTVQCFFRGSSNFHLPTDISQPVIMVGAGTGIAPFRSFWQHRDMMRRGETNVLAMGTMVLFTGCRTNGVDLYSKEKSDMVKAGVLDYAFLALSRQPTVTKSYVQDKLLDASSLVYRLLSENAGHFYVCGDCSMAEGVATALRRLLKTAGKLSDEQVIDFMLMLQDENRYHEDIFGITPRKLVEDPLVKNEKLGKPSRQYTDDTFL